MDAPGLKQSGDHPEANAYMFTGWLDQYSNGQFHDSCSSLILWETNEETVECI